MRALLALMLVGCASSADRDGPASSALEGVYSVVDYAVADGNCDGAATSEAPPFGWFQLEVQRVGNTDLLVMLPCVSASSCSDADAVFFADFDNFGAYGEAQSTSFDGLQCSLQWLDSTLDEDGDVVTLTTRTSEVSGVDGVDLDDCFAQQEAWTGPTPCVQSEIFTATPER